MKLTFGCIVVLFVAFSVLSQQGVAQDVRTSEFAYRQWLERRALAGKADLSDGHLGIGFSVVRYKQVGVLVDLSLAAGKDLSELRSTLECRKTAERQTHFDRGWEQQFNFVAQTSNALKKCVWYFQPA
jgi:hypothetical protein